MKTIRLNKDTVAYIDDEDYERVAKFSWWVKEYRETRATVYAKGKPYGIDTLMHRFILEPPPHLQVDHIDGNGLNNQRANLRLATHGQNQQNTDLRSDNTSGFKGVWPRPNGKWSAEVVGDGQRSYAGTFNTAKEAAQAYDAHAITLHGDFAKINYHSPLLEELPMPGLANSDKMCCPRGHPYSEENTKIRSTATCNSFRVCITCERDGQRERYQAKRKDFLLSGGESQASADKTHCKYGHSYSGDNLIIKTNKKSGKTQRVCRTCKNAAQRKPTG